MIFHLQSAGCHPSSDSTSPLDMNVWLKHGYQKHEPHAEEETDVLKEENTATGLTIFLLHSYQFWNLEEKE